MRGCLTFPEDRALCRVCTTSSWWATSLIVRGRLQGDAGDQCVSRGRIAILNLPRIRRSSHSNSGGPTHYFSTQGCAMFASNQNLKLISKDDLASAGAGCLLQDPIWPAQWIHTLKNEACGTFPALFGLKQLVATLELARSASVQADSTSRRYHWQNAIDPTSSVWLGLDLDAGCSTHPTSSH